MKEIKDEVGESKIEDMQWKGKQHTLGLNSEIPKLSTASFVTFNQNDDYRGYEPLIRLH